jgi:hypothetical protein
MGDYLRYAFHPPDPGETPNVASAECSRSRGRVTKGVARKSPISGRQWLPRYDILFRTVDFC